MKRRSTPKTKAGQYMCHECGRIFDDKKAVDRHIRMEHEPYERTIYGYSNEY
jgi:uncharacterized C2H2 Zn-finger protein